MSEYRDSLISDIIVMGWEENISYGEIAYLESLTNGELETFRTELMREI